MRKELFLLTLSLNLTACSSMFEAVTSRAITSDHLDKPHDRNKMRTQTGDRRGIYFLERKFVEKDAAGKDSEVSRLIICSEPFPGAMSVRGASSGLTITGEGEAKDAITATIQAVDARAAAVRLFETVEFTYCRRYQDGTLTPDQYISALNDISGRAFQSLNTTADASKPTPISTAAAKTTPAPPD